MGKIYDKASIIVPQGSAYETAYVWATKPLTDDGKQNYIRNGSATRITDCGEVKEVGSNIPQYDYIDGLPWVKLEKQSTNLEKNSHGFTNGGTNQFNPNWYDSNVTISNNAAISPEGKINATKLTLTTSSFDTYTTYQGLTNGTAYTWSCYVKLGTAASFCVVPNDTQNWNAFNAQSGAIKKFTSADGLSTTEWKRISVEVTANSTAEINLHLGSHSNSSISQQDAGTVFIWGIQMEASRAPTSLIKTTGSAVTRPQNFYNADAFKSGYEFTPAGWSYATKIKWGAEYGNGGNVKRFATSNYSSVWYLLEPYNNGTAYISLGPAGAALLSGVNLDKFIVYRYNGTVLSVYNNGNLIGSGTAAMGGNFTQKDRYGDSGFIGHIGDELYFNQCLSADEAIQLSLQ